MITVVKIGQKSNGLDSWIMLQKKQETAFGTRLLTGFVNVEGEPKVKVGQELTFEPEGVEWK